MQMRLSKSGNFFFFSIFYCVTHTEALQEKQKVCLDVVVVVVVAWKQEGTEQPLVCIVI